MILSHILVDIWLLIHAGKLIHVNKKGLRKTLHILPSGASCRIYVVYLSTLEGKSLKYC